MGSGDQWADVGARVGRVAHGECGGLGGEGGGETLVEAVSRVLHQDARGAEADLTGVEKGGAHRGVDGEADVAVREDEHGILATELERELGEARRHLTHGYSLHYIWLKPPLHMVAANKQGVERRHRGSDGGAGVRPPREGEGPHARVGAQRRARLLAGAMHDVEDARRQARSFEQPGQHRGGGGREL